MAQLKSGMQGMDGFPLYCMKLLAPARVHTDIFTRSIAMSIHQEQNKNNYFPGLHSLKGLEE